MEQLGGGGGQPCWLGGRGSWGWWFTPFYSSSEPLGRLLCPPAVPPERDLG